MEALILNTLLRAGITLIIVSLLIGGMRIFKYKQIFEGSVFLKRGSITGAMISLISLGGFLMLNSAEAITVSVLDVATTVAICLGLLALDNKREEKKRKETEREKYMGANIWMITEKKNPRSNNWEVIGTNENIDLTGDIFSLYFNLERRGTMFAILNGFGREYYPSIAPICEARGLPSDASEAVKTYLDNLVNYSYLTLEDINFFDWDADCDVYGEKKPYKQWAGEFYTKVIPYLYELRDGTSAREADVRVVFGYSINIE